MAIDASLRLQIYNDALRHLGGRSLASLTEARESRRILDSAWRPTYLLEKASWNFAMRTVQAIPSPSVEPDFGFRLAYDKPDDFARLVMLSADETFFTPMVGGQFTDEAGFWFTDIEPMFAKYVSTDDDYGMNGGLWPATFIKWAGLQLAMDCCKRITGSDDALAGINALLRRARAEAKSEDAQDEGVRFPPTGGWVRSRRYGGPVTRDRR